MKKISVIVPVYNVEKYLEQCLESIINQNYNNIEIIIVNDGSTDGSYDICKKKARLDKRIIVINQENKGLSAARNIGLEKATGEYIGFVDGDDFIAKDMYSTMIEYMEDTSIDLVEIGYFRYGKEIIETVKGKKYICEGKEIAIKNLLNGNMYNYMVWSKLYKKAIIGTVKFPINVINEDVYFNIDIFKKCNKIQYINLPKYYWRENMDSITRKRYSEKNLDILLANAYIIENVKHDKELYDLALKRQLQTIMSHYIEIEVLKNDRNYIKIKNILDKELQAIVKKILEIENLDLGIKLHLNMIKILGEKYIYFYTSLILKVKKNFIKIIFNNKKLYKLVKKIKRIY